MNSQGLRLEFEFPQIEKTRIAPFSRLIDIRVFFACKDIVFIADCLQVAAKALLLEVNHEKLAEEAFKAGHVFRMQVNSLTLLELVLSSVLLFNFFDSLGYLLLEKLLLLGKLIVVLVLVQHFFQKISF